MYYIGLDVGGTGIQCGIVNLEGKILYSEECKTRVEAGFEAMAEDIGNLIENTVSNAKVSWEEINSIGIGIPGVANREGLIIHAVNLKVEDAPLGEILRKRFGKKVVIENDATVAALAEYHFGGLKGSEVGVMITLGTGVGGGIIINGKTFSGARGMGSELGHIHIGKSEFDCNCGNNGCFEMFCSATAIIKKAQLLISNGEHSSILKEGSVIEDITAKDVFDSFRQGDLVAVKIVEEFKEKLGFGIAMIVNVLDPDVITIGGGMSRAHDVFLPNLREGVKKHVIFKSNEVAKINIANMGNDAGIVGAAMLGI